MELTFVSLNLAVQKYFPARELFTFVIIRVLDLAFVSIIDVPSPASTPGPFQEILTFKSGKVQLKAAFPPLSMETLFGDVEKDKVLPSRNR